MLAIGFEPQKLKKLCTQQTSQPIIIFVNYFIQIKYIKVAHTSCAHSNLVLQNILPKY